jgi:hypothetical protein
MEERFPIISDFVGRFGSGSLPNNKKRHANSIILDEPKQLNVNSLAVLVCT